MDSTAIIVAIIGASGAVFAAWVAQGQRKLLNEIKPRDAEGRVNGLRAGEVLYELQKHAERVDIHHRHSGLEPVHRNRHT